VTEDMEIDIIIRGLSELEAAGITRTLLEMFGVVFDPFFTCLFSLSSYIDHTIDDRRDATRRKDAEFGPHA